MKIYYELDLLRFDAWSGAVDTMETLTSDQIEELECHLPEILGEEVSDTTLNDFLWFETDCIAEVLGFYSWEHLKRSNDGMYEPIKIQCLNIDWNTDDEDEDTEVNLPESVLIELEDEADIEEWYEHKENGDEDDFLSDKLSDEYGFCVNSFEYKED